MEDLATYIDPESRISLTITRRSNTQDLDLNWGTGEATAIASNVVADLQPISGIAMNRQEKASGFPEEATHLLFPEMPIDMADHGHSLGIRTGDDIALTVEETDTVLNFQVIGINCLSGARGHQEIQLKEVKDRP